FPRSKQLLYCCCLLLCKLCLTVVFAFCCMPYAVTLSIRSILFRSYPFQITKIIVFPISVVMRALMTTRSWPDKFLQHKNMHMRIAATRLVPQRDLHIS